MLIAWLYRKYIPVIVSSVSEVKAGSLSAKLNSEHIFNQLFREKEKQKEVNNIEIDMKLLIFIVNKIPTYFCKFLIDINQKRLSLEEIRVIFDSYHSFIDETTGLPEHTLIFGKRMYFIGHIEFVEFLDNIVISFNVSHTKDNKPKFLVLIKEEAFELVRQRSLAKN
jgi:hypothetical protein